MNDGTATMDPTALEGAGEAPIEDEHEPDLAPVPDPDDEDGDGPPRGAEDPDVVMQADGQLSFSVGGKRPTSASLRLVGGKIDLEGEFKKGDVVRVVVEARVGEVAFVDKHDSETGQVTATERRHKARIIGVQRA